MISNMGYVIKEHPSDGIRGSKRQSLVKTTNKHIISINFEYRKRIMLDPADYDKFVRENDPETYKKM